MPIGTSGWPMTVRGVPMRRSSAESISQPPPRAMPSITPMVRYGAVWMRWNSTDAMFGSVAATGSDGGHRDEQLDVAVHEEEVGVGAAEHHHADVASASSSSSNGNSPMIRSAPTMLTGGRSSTTCATRPSIVQRTPLRLPHGTPPRLVSRLRTGRDPSSTDRPTLPPSTAMTWPLMKRAAGEHRNSTV